MVWIKKGMKGEYIKTHQRDLKVLGYYKGTIDGYCGPIMEAAIKKFQKENEITVDGILGPETEAKIDTYLVNNPVPDTSTKTVTTKTPTTVPSSKGKLQKKLEDEIGNFKTATEMYKQFAKKSTYIWYKNSKYTNPEARKRAGKGLPMNCVDYSQLCYPVLKEMGYDVKFAYGTVKCSKNGEWWTHIWLQVKGHEFKNTTNFDIVSVAHQGKDLPLGTLCCIYGTTIKEIDPGWLFTQEGKYLNE
jgi:hypothetical protein